MKDFVGKLLRYENTLSDKFHKKSSILNYKDFKNGSKMPLAWIQINYKSYPRLDKVKLPSPGVIKGNLINSLKKRRSERNFSNRSISLKSLSTLIHFSGGISRRSDNNWNETLRFYPSAGARYPLEIYIIVNRIEKLSKGLYHYNLKNNNMEALFLKDLSGFVSKKIGDDLLSKASFFILISAVLDRSRIKYAERGYRFALIEAGHLGQNLYLVSNSLGLKCCAIGGFVDDAFNRLLDLEGQNEKLIYILAFGK